MHGWLFLDKPQGLSSTQATSKVKRLIGNRKAGHAGTLDPMATGLLPIAFGEATKTMPYLIAENKSYDFTIKWGEQTNTGDAEGTVTATSDHMPTAADILAVLPQFHGTLQQTPPAYSAIKVDGRRAYALARAGETVALASRPVTIHCLELTNCQQPGYATLSVSCSKGTYVRTLAEDIAKALNTYGHLVALRRTAVGSFTIQQALTLQQLQEKTDACRLLQPVHAILDGIPVWPATVADKAALSYGKAIATPTLADGLACVMQHNQLLAIGCVTAGQLQPKRVFSI